MPHAELPSTPGGWLVALIASFAGFIAGFLVLAVAGRWADG